MPKIGRVEAIGYPHHVTQRGNRRQNVFMRQGDQDAYLRILKLQSELFGLKIWAYCLMDNHIHLIAVPEKEGAMTRAIGETHRLYTRMINFREKWKGYLWQGRFSSFPLDTNYLYNCVRYVECNPVRAGLVRHAEDYLYSSARAHVAKINDPILTHFYLEKEIEDWSKYLRQDVDKVKFDIFHEHILTGRPLGEIKFIDELELKIGRILHKIKPGPRKR